MDKLQLTDAEIALIYDLVEEVDLNRNPDIPDHWLVRNAYQALAKKLQAYMGI